MRERVMGGNYSMSHNERKRELWKKKRTQREEERKKENAMGAIA